MNNGLRGGVDFGRAVFCGGQQCRCCGGECGDSYIPLLGGMRSTTMTNIVVVVNNTTKDINKLVSILFFYFVIFFPVFRKSLLEKRYNCKCI